MVSRGWAVLPSSQSFFSSPSTVILGVSSELNIAINHENQKFSALNLDSNVGSVSSAFTAAFSFQKRILLRQLSTCKYYEWFSLFSNRFQYCVDQQFLHLCVQKVVEAVLEEEVEEDGGDVGLRHRLVHRGVVRRQQRRDQPSVKHRVIDNVKNVIIFTWQAQAWSCQEGGQGDHRLSSQPRGRVGWLTRHKAGGEKFVELIRKF